VGVTGGRPDPADAVPSPPLSVLYPPGGDGAPDRSALGRPAPADTLRDLALDRVVEQLAARLVEPLRDVAATPLLRVDAVRYRQAVFADLRDGEVRRVVDAFETGMGEVAALRAHQAATRDRHEATLWAAHAAAAYVRAVDALAAGLPGVVVAGRATSPALVAFAAHATAYAVSPAFVAAREHAARVERGLADVRFAVWSQGARVTVARLGAEPDLQEQVLATFERFRQSDEPAPRRAPETGEWLDHVQAQILARVAALFPELFADAEALAAVVAAQVPDPTVGQVADELRFYLSYLDLLAPAEAAGLPTCLPEVSSDTKQLHAADTWDLPLGLDLVADERPVVTNDLELGGEERVLVVSGPNQGGKTTTARTFGQLHHLAALGCPVPGRAVRILLADQVLTVFEREETATDLGGRLGGELTRVHRVLDRLTPRSVVVLNEVFSSTAAQDARFLGRRVLERLIEADVPTVLVTFIDELSRLGPRTVSMVGLVDPADPTVRTLKVVRRRADGRAYADALAARYGLGHDDLVGRLAR
jgi:hypothetical protein